MVLQATVRYREITFAPCMSGVGRLRRGTAGTERPDRSFKIRHFTVAILPLSAKEKK